MLVVNFFGGPGCGKSTTAASLFSFLKMGELNVELVTEYAKDEVWNGNQYPLTFQPYVFGQQAWRIARLLNKVDIVVTDSPILLSTVYADEKLPQSFHDFVYWQHNQFNNLNFFLKRVKKFNPIGRHHSELESTELDAKIADKLKKLNIPVHEVLTGDGTAAIKAFGVVMQRLTKNE
jgi:hypothetical protein